ncbi:hypothetical protein PROFUN_10092 [Planoprotostelium fungivorum]|uniref:Uncharacterized protein n=1 Tax=Planoprotostelium fungivorum TaxID=1890364 RepID=A0A2P6NF15_9EUKA|nr:hypothetical protein PROFUN_10092 [Planoprotostelium fungivorum]
MSNAFVSRRERSALLLGWFRKRERDRLLTIRQFHGRHMVSQYWGLRREVFLTSDFNHSRAVAQIRQREMESMNVKRTTIFKKKAAVPTQIAAILKDVHPDLIIQLKCKLRGNYSSSYTRKTNTTQPSSTGRPKFPLEAMEAKKSQSALPTPTRRPCIILDEVLESQRSRISIQNLIAAKVGRCTCQERAGVDRLTLRYSAELHMPR